MKEIDFERAQDKIVKYLACGDKSLWQVKSKLFDYGCSASEAEKILKLLIEYGYVDDERFAQRFIDDGLNLKYHGKIKLQYDLRQKKIPEQIIQDRLDKISLEDEFESAYEFISIKLFSLNQSDDEARKKFAPNQIIKLKNLLIRRGYSFDVADKVLKKLLDRDE